MQTSRHQVFSREGSAAPAAANIAPADCPVMEYSLIPKAVTGIVDLCREHLNIQIVSFSRLCEMWTEFNARLVL